MSRTGVSGIDADVVAIAGDWHGYTAFARLIIREIAQYNEPVADEKRRIRWLLHLGDFGVWPGPRGSDYVAALEQILVDAGVRILVTPGNHEDWGRLRTEFESTSYRKPLIVSPHISVLPPGYRFQLRTSAGTVRQVLSVGGAPSVDFEGRTVGESWWPGEMLTDQDVVRSTSAGRADIVLAHDAPSGSTSLVREIVEDGGGWSHRALAYADKGRELMNQVYSLVLPDLWMHGHYHVYADELRPQHEAGLGTPGAAPDARTRFISLHRDGSMANTVRFDVETYTTEMLLT